MRLEITGSKKGWKVRLLDAKSGNLLKTYFFKTSENDELECLLYILLPDTRP